MGKDGKKNRKQMRRQKIISGYITGLLSDKEPVKDKMKMKGFRQSKIEVKDD